MATKKVRKIKKTSRALKVSIKRSKRRPKSFKMSRESMPFMSLLITEQTVYWSILLAYVLLLSLWIVRIQLDTLVIIDKLTN